MAIDFLTTDVDQNILKNLSSMGEYLKTLRNKMLEAEDIYERAKKEYEYYAQTILPMEMFNAGVSDIVLMNGGRMTYERKFYCQPNKNDTDRNIIATWLRQHGGDDLVKEAASVDGALINTLKEAGIPYVERDEINTNSLKAFIKDKIGANGGLAQIQLDEIPACIHFQEVGVVNITG